MEQKSERVKIFKGGKKTINISVDNYDLIKQEAESKGLYPSQVLDTIIVNYFNGDSNG